MVYTGIPPPHTHTGYVPVSTGSKHFLRSDRTVKKSSLPRRKVCSLSLVHSTCLPYKRWHPCLQSSKCISRRGKHVRKENNGDQDITSPINLCLENAQDIRIVWVILSLTDKACNLLVVSLDNNPEIKKKKKQGVTYVLTRYLISLTAVSWVSVPLIRCSVLPLEAAGSRGWDRFRPDSFFQLLRIFLE